MTSTTFADEMFAYRNRGRFGIRHAGVLITAKAFKTEREARKWARWNYFGRAKWTVELLSVEAPSSVTEQT